MEKIRYEVDPHNRLIYEKTGRESEVPGFRAVLDGEFKTDENNCLAYHVKKPQSSGIPQQIKLKGKWALNSEHNLVFALEKWGSQIAGDKLTIESELIDAKDNMLSFAVTSKDSHNNNHSYIVKLGGRWQADEYNRLIFNVQREAGISDRIILAGAWEVNKQNEIIYTYEKSVCGERSRTAAGNREKVINTVAFKGYWDITGKYRIKYVLNKKTGSGFDFKVSVGKPSARGLEYEIGMGAKPDKKTIMLFGSWKINENLGVLFDMPRAEGNIHSVTLGGWARLDKNCLLEISLQNKIGEDLGIDVKLSRKLLKDQGEAFIHTLKSREEVCIIAGAGFRW